MLKYLQIQPSYYYEKRSTESVCVCMYVTASITLRICSTFVCLTVDVYGFTCNDRASGKLRSLSVLFVSLIIRQRARRVG